MTDSRVIAVNARTVMSAFMSVRVTIERRTAARQRVYKRTWSQIIRWWTKRRRLLRECWLIPTSAVEFVAFRIGFWRFSLVEVALRLSPIEFHESLPLTISLQVDLLSWRTSASCAEGATLYEVKEY